MTEAVFSETLAKWVADSRLKGVCKRPLCRLHARGIHASGVFRKAIKMFSHDELSDSMIQACDTDADRVHGLTIEPLTKEEIDYPEAASIAYMVEYVENHMVDIKNDPTHQERPECSRTTENHLVALGNSSVYFQCCWKQAIFKVNNHELDSNGKTKDKDTFSDMTVAIRLDADLRRWLISIDYIKPNADDIDPRAKDAKTKKPKAWWCRLTPMRICSTLSTLSNIVFFRFQLAPLHRGGDHLPHARHHPRLPRAKPVREVGQEPRPLVLSRRDR